MATLRDDTRVLLGTHLQDNPALELLGETAERAVESVVACHRAGGKVLLCGNGGSAADCEHIAGELVKGFRLPRPLSEDEVTRFDASGDARLSKTLQHGVAALPLTGHFSLTTAIINDIGGEWVFAQQVLVLGRRGDVLMAISTSGNSPNVLAALRVARAQGMATVGLTGQGGGEMAPLCDVLLDVPERETFKVQELHLPLYHALCLAIEHEVFAQQDEVLQP